MVLPTLPHKREDAFTLDLASTGWRDGIEASFTGCRSAAAVHLGRHPFVDIYMSLYSYTIEAPPPGTTKMLRYLLLAALQLVPSNGNPVFQRRRQRTVDAANFANSNSSESSPGVGSSSQGLTLPPIDAVSLQTANLVLSLFTRPRILTSNRIRPAALPSSLLTQ